MRESPYGRPLIVEQLDAPSAHALTPVGFDKSSGATYSENWLQTLISRYPNTLPIDQIEPGFTSPVSICMELNLPSGYVDNVYVTPAGDIIIGEAKLFRNPEARREVVGQIIDYAKDLSALSYETFNELIWKAEAPDGQGGKPQMSLYETVKAQAGEALDEAKFIDTISRNLSRGRFLLLIIGDGIQEGTEKIAAFLQQHAGMHFTLGLVELNVFKLPEHLGGYLVQPRVLLRTKNIDRGIVTIEDNKIAIKPPPGQVIQSQALGKSMSITEEQFYEQLAANYPQCIQPLKAFTAEAEQIGIRFEFGKESMILRWWSDEKRKWNLGTITVSGKVWTDQLNITADSIGLIHLSQAYLKELAQMIPGASIKELPNPRSRYVMKNGTYITIEDLLAHKEAWLGAMQHFMAAVSEALAS